MICALVVAQRAGTYWIILLALHLFASTVFQIAYKYPDEFIHFCLLPILFGVSRIS